MIKPCRGCRHFSGGGICYAHRVWAYRYDPYIGRQCIQAVSSPLGELVRTMRAPGGDCGPDATLYSPTLWRRIWGWLFRSPPSTPSPRQEGE